LDSELDDKKSWLNSIVQSVIAKPLENIKDEDELVLFEKFKNIIRELDVLTDLSGADFDETQEEVLSVELGNLSDGVKKSLVRYPVAKTKQIDALAKKLKNELSEDKTTNIVALTNLLKEMIK
jgi:hypothetical protein